MSNSDDETKTHHHHQPPPQFSTITQTINRQFKTVASFLAPPPHQPYSPPPLPLPSDEDVSVSDSPSSSYEGLKNDLAEIGDKFKTLFSPKKAFSKLASNLLQFGERSDLDDAVGVSDDVLDFVGQISTRPECWLDFPLSLQNQDFNMSNVQKDHAIAIQELVPNLTTLRHTIHNDMSEQQFWMIYFVLLIPRLNEVEYRLLSTPEIVQLREIALQKLRNKNTPNSEQSENPIQETESLGETDNATNRIKNKNSEDGISFSDLDDESLSEYKQTQSCRFSSASESSDWVRLSETAKANRSVYRERRSESEESTSDWHAVEDIDL